MKHRYLPPGPCTTTKLDDTGSVIAVEVKEFKTQKRGSKGSGSRVSTRAMTDDDARRVMFGDLKDERVGSAANTLGLSYGQVYSARGGYTFKHIVQG